MLSIFLVIVLFLILIVIIGSFWQKDLFVKLLFLNATTSLISLFICFLGSVKANSYYLDIALIYFLLSVVASCAYLKYFMQKHKKDMPYAP